MENYNVEIFRMDNLEKRSLKFNLSQIPSRGDIIIISYSSEQFKVKEREWEIRVNGIDRVKLYVESKGDGNEK